MTNASLRGLWLACTLLFGAIVGICVGLLSILSGSDLANAIIDGGAAAAGATAFVILLIHFLTPPEPPSSGTPGGPTT